MSPIYAILHKWPNGDQTVLTVGFKNKHSAEKAAAFYLNAIKDNTNHAFAVQEIRISEL